MGYPYTDNSRIDSPGLNRSNLHLKKGHTTKTEQEERTAAKGPYQETFVRDDVGRIKDVIPKGNPLKDLGVKQTIKQLCKRAKWPTANDVRLGMRPYEPKKAPPFAVKDLLRMPNYCYKSVEGLRGLWLWTITIFSFACFTVEKSLFASR
ncbi:uncharacterized protein LOC116619781 [Nematostella vectensis]|uniref:uncharacterized protein LOC116619781 n=1 Tax=Nematostella vectensis TaxID=45351 RepID=UPI00138FE0A3|nr:uncharacterized protein LOC116619781 [Nematostella vectensis]